MSNWMKVMCGVCALALGVVAVYAGTMVPSAANGTAVTVSVADDHTGSMAQYIAPKKFVGYTSGTYTKYQGFRYMHYYCRNQYGAGARLCTDWEYANYNGTVTPPGNSWFHVTPAGGASNNWNYFKDRWGNYHDYSGASNCWGYRESGWSSPYIRSNGSMSGYYSAGCSNSYYLTCCK